MTKDELKNVLDEHKLWLDSDGREGNRADLSDADLSGANLRRANLSGANLRGANLDYSSWPLWCGGLDVHIDDRQAVQLLYHLVRNVLYSKNTSDNIKEILGTEDIISLANTFHRVEECGKIQPTKKEDNQ